LYLRRGASEPEVASRNGVRQKLDVKGEGNYVVAPPSRHPTGRMYEWTKVVPIAAAPPWVHDLAPQRRAKAAEAAAQATLNRAAAAASTF
jgi:hypothetical protein